MISGWSHKSFTFETPVMTGKWEYALANPQIALEELSKEELIAIIYQQKEQQKNVVTTPHLAEAMCRGRLDSGIFHVNQKFASLFGCQSVEEVLAWGHQTMKMHASSFRRLRRLIRQQGSLQNYEILLRRKDNSQFWCSISTAMLTDEHGCPYYEAVLHDISNYKEAARKLKENFEELKKVNGELDRFVYSASHDLRAPLVSILGLVQVARLEADEEQRQHYFSLINNSVDKLDRFCREIVYYSRNARLGIRREKVNLRRLIQEVLSEFQFTDEFGQVQVDVSVSQKSTFYTDSQRVSVILRNLISNALRYNNAHRWNSFVTIKADVQGRELHLEISDNGIGISEQHLPHIFSMFYRACERSKGSGLGLYIVKETLDKLRGTIQVDSRLGKGSTFAVCIPEASKTQKV